MNLAQILSAESAYLEKKETPVEELKVVNVRLHRLMEDRPPSSRERVIAILRASPNPIAQIEITRRSGMTYTGARQLIERLMKTGKVIRSGDKYRFRFSLPKRHK